MTVLIPAVAALLAGGALAWSLLVARFVADYWWRSSLMVVKVSFAADTDADAIEQWLGAVATWTHPGRLRGIPSTPIVVETVAGAGGIEHYIVASAHYRAALLTGLRALLPAARVEDAPTYLRAQWAWRVAGEWRMNTKIRPLNHSAAGAANRLILAGLQPLIAGEHIRIQWMLTGARTPKPIKRRPPRDGRWLFDGDRLVRDSEEISAQREKHKRPLLRATARIAVSAKTRKRARAVFRRVWPAVQTVNRPGAMLGRRWLPTSVVARRVRRRTWPWVRWPLLLNTSELTGILGPPITDTPLPGLTQAAARLLPAPPAMRRTGGVTLGATTYPGPPRPLILQSEDRLRHTYVLGPTGVGKSTLLAHLIVQDMVAGDAVVLIEPKGDLVKDVLDRVPRERVDDVVVLDPSKTDRPVGFNLLGLAQGEQAGELVADHITHILHQLYASSWGPRTADVIRSAIHTLAVTRAADGSRFTLCELPEILTNPSFRAYVLSQTSMPASLRTFWLWFEALSEPERVQVVGPVMNKIRSFVTRTPLRLLLGQSEGIDLDEVFARKQILLVPLCSAEIGEEAAHLVGSLLTAAIWRTTLARSRLPRERRHPVWCYLDEFQHITRLPLALPDMFSEARSYGLGLVVAHQVLGQLDKSTRAAILGNVGSQVYFHMDLDDAKTIAPRLAPLTPADLTGLAKFEIAVKPCVDGTVRAPVTGATQLPTDPTTDGVGLARYSRSHYGTPRKEVENAIAQRIIPPAATPELGAIQL